ncbi:DUF6338 family protein [Cereibacter azotoformans]|uniref:Uncharacterized protein n=1 Tax=Cereibacter sphaeroides (strain ATCC 17025 / ATH 2.4.3) TaxID=349102 RepID=A4WR01_CERS5|nr:DUF6338 family protein [Cereibacter azotoformans]ULB09146.1 DUF6338 family protein [Cereibacter azotoformans]
MDLKSPEEVRLALYLVVPGLIAAYFRAQFLAGRTLKPADSILAYLAISLTYWAIIMVSGIPASVITTSSFWSVVAVLVGPALFGSLLGLNARFDLIRNLLRKAGLNPVHPMQTAWDWKFSRTTSRFVIVSMTNGENVGGLYGGSSFSSSEPSERDIFLEKQYKINEAGEWQELPGREILIRHSEIRYIEFFPMQAGA